MQGVILYGPPAAGKDSITAELKRLDKRYHTFERLKSGAGRTHGYRMTSESAIEDLRIKGDVVWENHRYGAVYVVDRPTLIQGLTEGIPVVHLGQVEAVERVTSSTPGDWLVVSLWCPRDTAAARIIGRGSTDLDARLRAWDETEPLPSADLTLNTAEVSAKGAAQLIENAVRSRRSDVPL